MTPLLPPWAAMALVAGTLAAMLLGLRALRGRAHVEVLRKLVHVGMGLVTLTFPWLFVDSWPVITLAIGASLLLLLLRRGTPAGWGGPAAQALREKLGGVVDGVARNSLGEIYFPIAVAVLFFLARGDAVAFCVPLLLLTLSDAVAALIGVRYGALRYTTDEGQKSWEGSIAFFVTAFLSVHIPLLLFTNIGRAECLYIGLILGLLVMLLEASAWGGLDNLFIPLGGYLLLQAFRNLEAPALGWRLAVTLALVAFALIWRSRTTLNHGAVLGAVVIGFVAWAIGGWRWLLPPVTLFALYAVLFPRTGPDGRAQTHDARDVIQVTGIGMFWLFVAYLGKKPEYLIPYTVTFAAHLTVIGAPRHRVRFADPRTWPTMVAVTILSTLVLLLPIVVTELISPSPAFPLPTLWWACLLAFPGVFLAFLGDRCGAPVDNPPPQFPIRSVVSRQVGILLGSLLPLLAFLGSGGKI